MHSFGSYFRISLYGTSHGSEVGVLVEGCPPGISIEAADFDEDLARRQPQGKSGTSRREKDSIILTSGVYKGHTTGGPIMIRFENREHQSEDYDFRDVPRPGHADFVAERKYKSFNDPRGGGFFSGRMTIGMVAAGVIAKKILLPAYLHAWLEAPEEDPDEIAKEGDSIGGIVHCRGRDIPLGWGEPFFDSVESRISHIMFAIPGLKAIGFGAGVNAAQMKGSAYNDAYIDHRGHTASNNDGGINGGISNGNPLFFSTYFKPSASIPKAQKTFDFKHNRTTELSVEGRHDACYAKRTPVIVEAAAAIALADLKLTNRS